MRSGLALRSVRAFGLVAAVALVWPATSMAQDRGIGATQRQDRNKIALVIGNGSYDTAPLRNPPNDARDMARTLRDLGFEVIHRRNADQVEMKRAVREFGDRIRRADVALFYYAGHAVQAQGRNYLIPVGAVINSEPEVEYESVDAGFVIAQMEAAGSPLNIVILDACRNNPFARSFRSSSRGLTQVTAPTGTLIAYATAPGSVASDGDGENGLYTQELLRFMQMPGLSVEEVFKQVRISLIEQTGGDQTPWESSSLVGDFYFAGRRATEPAEPEPEPAAPESEPEPAADQEADPGEPVVSDSTESRVPGTPPAPSLDDFDTAFDACIEPLATGNLGLFGQRFAGDERPEARNAVRRWLRDAAMAEVRRGENRPGIEVSEDARAAVAGVNARFAWRSGFGLNRSAVIPIESVMTFRNGGWVLETCRIAGPVTELR